jgi:CRISPR-associated endonuclease/helicase Cas3
MTYYAHSENSLGKRHELKDHLAETAERTKAFAPAEAWRDWFHRAGLLHDAGKFRDEFQEYLEKGKPRTLHAGIGAYLASLLGKECIPHQFAIQGHHAGMPNNEERQQNNKDYAEEKELVGVLRQRLELIFPDALSAEEFQLPSDGLQLECLTRILFSALTDADWLDTEGHFTPEKSAARQTTTLDCDRLLTTLERKFAELLSEGKINELRTIARNEAIQHFGEPPGFFSLQLPTGLGKTLTSVYWALLHARQHKLKRIIIVLPYINIIDQTASILKDIFGEDAVLEHHSGIIDEDREYEKETFDRSPESIRRLACENWDVPFILTTAVQFFESLFSNKPFKCRKNHNIAESVVIFDEIQTLPKHLVEPTIIMLRNVSSIARTSFLFCTATLPAFAKREGLDGIDTISPLIKNPKFYFDATRRVDYKSVKKLKPVSLEEISERLLKEKSSYLVIVNTKAVARELYKMVMAEGTHDLYFHLSTAMCPHHRKRTMREISAALDPKSNTKIAVFSTQLVEAGVDFDFPCVYRAIAPLDSLIQAAGRCNRNGNAKRGKVVLFDLLEHKMPDSTYRSCAAFAKGIVQDDPEILHDAEAFERYYRQVITLFVNPDRFGITDERRRFNFRTVNDQYRIIDTPTTPLFIANYSEESEELRDQVVRAMEFRGFISREQYRKLQQFSVQVYPGFLGKHKDQIETIRDTFKLWLGKYDPAFGIAPEDIETVF